MDNTNKPETEEDGQRAGALRLLKVRQQFQALTGRTHGLLPLPSSTSELTSRNNVVAHHVSEVPGQLNES